MDHQENRAFVPSYTSGIAVIGFIMIILGILFAYFFKDKWFGQFGWIFVSFGIPILIWRIFYISSNFNIIRLISIMKKEKLLMIVKDKVQGKKIIEKSILDWASDNSTIEEKKCTLKIKGITLHLILGNRGILAECIKENKILNREDKLIQILLLNPYSMNAISRSIAESRPFILEKDPVEAICSHSLTQHKEYILFRDFKQTLDNIKDLIANKDKYKVKIECKIYSTPSPSFLLLNKNTAIIENLIQGRMHKHSQKLYGILPHFVYGRGEIKDSLENQFNYIWNYNSVLYEDFYEEVEEKYYEISRLFILYNLQKLIWDREWKKAKEDQRTSTDYTGRSLKSTYDILYQEYLNYFPNHSPDTILDLGCGDGGGGSLILLKENPKSKIDYVDISNDAIDLLIDNIKKEGLNAANVNMITADMLTFLNKCEYAQYSLIFANFSIIYMTKIKAIEIYRKIFKVLQHRGIFMLSLWTVNYFNMPIGKHGDQGVRPNYTFTRVPMTEDLRILSEGSEIRRGEIRRFYNNFEELREEFKNADENEIMDYENIKYKYYENGAVLRVWLVKK